VTGAHLRQDFVDPERASLIDGEGVKKAYPRRPYVRRVQNLGQHVYFSIDESSSRCVDPPLLNPDFCRCFIAGDDLPIAASAS